MILKYCRHRISYQTVQQYCLSKNWGDYSTCCQNYTSKNHPKDILHDENHLNETYVECAFKAIHMAGYWILKQSPKPTITKTRNFSSYSLPHCLTTFTILGTKQSIVQPQFYHTTNSPVTCVFWGSNKLLVLYISVKFVAMYPACIYVLCSVVLVFFFVFCCVLTLKLW